jgi:vacuolar protein sorting-associated protein 45
LCTQLLDVRIFTAVLSSIVLTYHLYSYVEMIRSAAATWPSTVFEPPPESPTNMPSLNLNLGGVNVSLGGRSGTGVYRTSGEGVSVQADGIRDGVKNLLGKVKQGVDRIAAQ